MRRSKVLVQQFLPATSPKYQHLAINRATAYRSLHFDSNEANHTPNGHTVDLFTVVSSLNRLVSVCELLYLFLLLYR